MKYKSIRIPIDAYKEFQIKIKNMKDSLKYLTGKNKRIPMTKFLYFISKRPIYIEDFELKKSFGGKKIRC